MRKELDKIRQQKHRGKKKACKVSAVSLDQMSVQGSSTGSKYSSQSQDRRMEVDQFNPHMALSSEALIHPFSFLSPTPPSPFCPNALVLNFLEETPCNPSMFPPLPSTTYMTRCIVYVLDPTRYIRSCWARPMEKLAEKYLIY